MHCHVKGNLQSWPLIPQPLSTQKPQGTLYSVGLKCSGPPKCSPTWVICRLDSANCSQCPQGKQNHLGRSLLCAWKLLTGTGKGKGRGPEHTVTLGPRGPDSELPTSCPSHCWYRLWNPSSRFTHKAPPLRSVRRQNME